MQFDIKNFEKYNISGSVCCKYPAEFRFVGERDLTEPSGPDQRFTVERVIEHRRSKTIWAIRFDIWDKYHDSDVVTHWTTVVPDGAGWFRPKQAGEQVCRWQDWYVHALKSTH